MRKLTSPVGILPLLLFIVASSAVCANPLPPCGDVYGTTANRIAIEDAMYSGTVQECIDSVNDGKATRGDRVGCRSDAWAYATPNTTRPTLSTLENLWNNVHAPGIAAYNESCAQLGREWPAAALGAYYANLAGYPAPMAVLQNIADQSEASQYSALYAPTPLITYPGVYGYSSELANSSSPCYRGGVVEQGINAWCGAVPSYCPTYNAGPWAGLDFLVVGFSLNPREYDGGLAYDHAWNAAFMLEASLQETNPTKAAIYAASATLAADWSAAEPAVKNHNYTAKNIWVLAQRYALTGDINYRSALQDRLDRNLKPGVLMDANGDGLVDGMTNQPFSGLTSVAQLPGRMWDGHNANMWYHSMNTWAAVEAYVAFRDQGDTALAADIRPYAIAMLDNLAWELTNLGPPAPAGEHMWPIPYSLLTALWKIADYEGESHPNWEDAAATLYNWGLFDSFSKIQGRATASLALYLLYETGTTYVPLALRTGGGGSTWTELSYDDFESGFGNYTDGGSDCSLYTGGTYAHEGSNAVNIQDNSGVSSSFFTTTGIDVDTAGYDEIKVEFWFTAVSMESGEDFWLQYFNGSTWQTIATYARGNGSSAYSFANGTFYFVEEIIQESSYTFPSNMKIRFMCDASSNGDDIAIDEVRVSARGSGGGGTPPDPASNPVPTDLASNINVDADLSWTAGTGSTSSDVYFGAANPPVFVQNQTGTTHDVGTLAYSTTYYWRIDEVNANGTTTGTVWSFITEAPPSGPETLLEDDFESGSFATEGWNTDWVYTTEVAVSGVRAVKCTSSTNDLISRNLDTSGRNSLTVSFYYYDDDIDNSDNVMIQFWNGSSYVSFAELGITSPEDTWNFYTVTINNAGGDSQYFRSDFKIKFEGSSIDFFENLGIDDVGVTVE